MYLGDELVPRACWGRIIWKELSNHEVVGWMKIATDDILANDLQ